MDFSQLSAVAILIERGIEAIVAPIFNNVKFLAKYKWVQMYIALIEGVGLAWAAQLNGVAVIVPGLTVPDPVAYVLTGLVMGGGGVLLHEVLDKYRARPPVLMPETAK